MGVQGLWSLIQPVARPIQLETLEGRKLAIDSSIWLYHFRMAMRDKEGKTLKNAHILGFFYRILKLLFYGIRPVFVFDGKAPTLKRKTLSKRKQVREGARDAHAVTAKKLLNAQLRQAAIKEVSSRSIGKKRADSTNAAQDELDQDNGLGENTVYFDDLDGNADDNRGEGSSKDRIYNGASRRKNSADQDEDEWMNELDPKESSNQRQNSRSISPTKKSSTVKKNDYHRDPYALPEMDRDFSSLTRTNGNNRKTNSSNNRANRTDIRFATEAEQRELMSQIKPSDLDTSSSFFLSLPTELQYELLGDMRSQSRGTSYKRLQSMLSSAPTPIDFSRSQIDGLKTRNKLTQKVLEVSDSIGDANIHIASSRVSGERNREYVLIRNKNEEIGYSLGVRDQGLSKEKAIEILNDSDDDERNDEESRSEEEEGMDFDQVDLENHNLVGNRYSQDSGDDDEEDQGGLNQSEIEQARKEGRMIADDPEKRLEVLRKLRNENVERLRKEGQSKGMAGRSDADGGRGVSNSKSRSNVNSINQRSGASLFLPVNTGNSSTNAIEFYEDDEDDELDEFDGSAEIGVGTSASRKAALEEGEYDHLLPDELGEEWEDSDEVSKDQGFTFEDFEDEDPLSNEMRKSRNDQLELDEMDDLPRALELSRNDDVDEEMEMDEVEVGSSKTNQDDKKSFETTDYEAALAALDDSNFSQIGSPPLLATDDSPSQSKIDSKSSYQKRATHQDSGPALGFRYQDRTGEPERLDLSNWKKERERREKEEREKMQLQSKSENIIQKKGLSLEERQEIEREKSRKKQIERMRKGREWEDLENQEKLEKENERKRSEEMERERKIRIQREEELEQEEEIKNVPQQNSSIEDEELEEMEDVDMEIQEGAEDEKSSPIGNGDQDVRMYSRVPSSPRAPSHLDEKEPSLPPSPSLDHSKPSSNLLSKNPDVASTSFTTSTSKPPTSRISPPSQTQSKSENRLQSEASISSSTQLGSRRNAGAGAKAKIRYVSQDASVEERPQEIESQAERELSKAEDLAQRAAGVAQGDELGDKMGNDLEIHREIPASPQSPSRQASVSDSPEEVEMEKVEGVNEVTSEAGPATMDNISSKEAEQTKPASNKRARLLSPTSLRNPNIHYDSDSGTPFSDSDEEDDQPELGPDGFPLPTAEELAAMEAEDLEELGGSKNDFASFLSKSRSVGLSEAQEEIEREVAALKAEHANTVRSEEDITIQMATEVQTMLRLFGIPFITAPAEAEAQCAELVILKLVDGIITDDSDVFCFGGNRVYKNMFNQNKIVECFLLSDLQRELGIDREKLVQLAYLLGSDYTEGLVGVGPVLAMEILALFDNQDGLINFKNWWLKVQSGSDSKDDTKGNTMKKIKKSLRNKVHLEENWPNPEVLDAYYEPMVDKSEEPFTWGLPDLDGLRTILKAFLGWNQEKTDHHLLPVIESQRRRNKKKQSTLDKNGFFDNTGGLGAYSARQAPKYKSNRLQEVVQAFRSKNRPGNNRTSNTNKTSTSKSSKPSKEKKSPAAPKSRKGRQVGDDDDDDHPISASDQQEGEKDQDQAGDQDGDSSDGFEIVDEAVLGRAMGQKRPIVRREENDEAPQTNLDKNIEALEGKNPNKRKRNFDSNKSGKEKKDSNGKRKGKGKRKRKEDEAAESEEDESESTDEEEFRPKSSSRGRGRGRGKGKGGASSSTRRSNKARLSKARSINLDEVADEVNLDTSGKSSPKSRPKPRPIAGRKAKANGVGKEREGSEEVEEEE